ncbi:MAG TPA: DEAD/DEAH box helicase, partial [Xanthobacteraceae bacterium]|nr:DEAD/DEAH box helicase [Xanthobacteraceae bacterium]
DLAQRLVASDCAIADGSTLLVEHRAVSRLSARDAASLGLPALAEVVAHVETSGLITRPEFRAKLSWRRPTGQPVVGAGRVGAWLRIGDEWRRVPDALFDIAEAVDRLNAAPAEDVAARLISIDALREALPPAVALGKAEAAGLLGTMTIAIADAFSLDLKGDGAEAKLVPILHRAGANPDAPLLPPREQSVFGEDQFNRFQTARPVYALGSGWYVVLSPPLRRALAEVRRVQSAPLATKRALIAAPRAFLRQALGDDTDDTVIDAVFRETAAYAERVVGLGLWAPRVVPWIRVVGTDWFGPEVTSGPRTKSPEPEGGIRVGDRIVPLTSEQAEALREEIEAAIGAQHPVVPVTSNGATVDVPATDDTLAALEALRQRRLPREPGTRPDERDAPEVLLIRPNEETVEVEGSFTPRPSPPIAPPACVATPLKQHQAEGLIWLQKAWAKGCPGVLLADDMGLGKTLQGLAFLAWLREGMTSGAIATAPLIIVAPTGLLENWRAEHDRHLAAPGLGRRTDAYGRGLATLRILAADGRPGIDVEALGRADWVLTTYETLRDYDRDFGRVRFAVMLFDEAQKIKTPGVRITDAAKAMNADFRVALTGTPVENRLADLWCITDTVHPALLGDLKSFSAEYEREPDVDRLSRLKATLDRWHGDRPPLLLRRLKADRLPELPAPEEVVSEAVMSPEQRAAYEAAVAQAREDRRPGAALDALQRLRALSLHPDGQMRGPDHAFIAASARMRVAFEALDRIAEQRERALIFLDDLDLQSRLVGVVQRRYHLGEPPMLISGQVEGSKRQVRVDRFQAGPDEFDVMIMSPRAGGVGLTLTRANHVIHLSRWWNPAVEDQCTGRALRIGQTRRVFVHIPMAILPEGRRSFDQNLHALLQRKRRLIRDALMPPAATEVDRNDLFNATVH